MPVSQPFDSQFKLEGLMQSVNVLIREVFTCATVKDLHQFSNTHLVFQ